VKQSEIKRNSGGLLKQKELSMSSALLVLEDGTVFSGESLGLKGVVCGPIFFDTRVVGYQEIMTDPSNAGKILVFTYPLIGNYGINDKFSESSRAWVKGVVIKERSKIYSNWQAKGSFDDFLKREKVLAIAETDTRTLTIHLREKGEMWAGISTNGKKKEELLVEIKKDRQKTPKSLIKEVSTREVRLIKGKTKIRVGILDVGMLQGLLVQLRILGLEIALLPYDIQPTEILKLKLKGLIIPSGPEDDPVLDEIIFTIKNLLGKIPMLGIALGAQVLAKSLGAKIKEMRLGHRGVNYPVKYPASFKGDITVQNHSRTIDLDSLKKSKPVQITAVHLNDGTVEGFASKKYKIIAVQYYPVSPGFSEVNNILIRFLQLMKGKN